MSAKYCQASCHGSIKYENVHLFENATCFLYQLKIEQGGSCHLWQLPPWSPSDSCHKPCDRCPFATSHSSTQWLVPAPWQSSSWTNESCFIMAVEVFQEDEVRYRIAFVCMACVSAAPTSRYTTITSSQIRKKCGQADEQLFLKVWSTLFQELKEKNWWHKKHFEAKKPRPPNVDTSCENISRAALSHFPLFFLTASADIGILL